MSKTKIAIVEDSRLVTTLLYPTINNLENCHVFLEANNGREFLNKLQPANLPDLVLLDLIMPVLDGFDTAKEALATFPDMKILVLSSIYTDEVALRLIRLGVRGFIRKEDISADELLTAIKTVIETGYYYAGQMLFRIAGATDEDSPHKKKIHLTEVEIAFIRLACTEMTYRVIALQMGVSPRTVDGYREEIFSKLHIKTRVALALFAVKNGLVRL
jgi:DNA-binding NarL/FixJ family response regulator